MTIRPPRTPCPRFPSVRRRLVMGAVVFTALAHAGLVTRKAHACGGLFCDGPPPNPFSPLPVAQNGENVVFSIVRAPGSST